LFNWTKIEVEGCDDCKRDRRRRQCCEPHCQPACQAVQAAPMAFQPVQVQFTAYQPMMMAPQFIAAPQVMAAPMMAPMAAPVSYAPAAPMSFRPAAAPHAAADDCNLSNVCDRLKALQDRVDALTQRMDAQKDTSELERRVTQLEESSKLQTEILQEMRTYFQNQAAPAGE
jgi:hypothetical protein